MIGYERTVALIYAAFGDIITLSKCSTAYRLTIVVISYIVKIRGLLHAVQNILHCAVVVHGSVATIPYDLSATVFRYLKRCQLTLLSEGILYKVSCEDSVVLPVLSGILCALYNFFLSLYQRDELL